MARQWDPASLSALGGAFKGMREGLLTGSALATEAQQRKQRALEIEEAERQAEFQKAYAALPTAPEERVMPGTQEQGTVGDEWSRDMGPIPGVERPPLEMQTNWKEFEERYKAVGKLGGPEAMAKINSELAAMEQGFVRSLVGTAGAQLTSRNGEAAFNTLQKLVQFNPDWAGVLDGVEVSEDGKHLLVTGPDDEKYVLPHTAVTEVYGAMQDPAGFAKLKSEIIKNYADAEAKGLSAVAAALKNNTTAGLKPKELMELVDKQLTEMYEMQDFPSHLKSLLDTEDVPEGWFRKGKLAPAIRNRMDSFAASTVQANQDQNLMPRTAAEIGMKLYAHAHGVEGAEAPKITPMPQYGVAVVTFKGYPPIAVPAAQMEAFMSLAPKTKTEPTTEPVGDDESAGTRRDPWSVDQGPVTPSPTALPGQGALAPGTPAGEALRRYDREVGGAGGSPMSGTWEDTGILNEIDALFPGNKVIPRRMVK